MDTLTKFLTYWKGPSKSGKALKEYIDSVMQPAIRSNISQKAATAEDFMPMRNAEDAIFKMIDSGKHPNLGNQFNDVNINIREKLGSKFVNEDFDIGLGEYPDWLQKQKKFKDLF